MGEQAAAGIFTEYVRSLEKGEPDAVRFAALRRALRAALRNELRRRGLWDSPPTYLGVYGWERWEERPDAGGDALDELVADGYAFVFVDRLRNLRAHLAVKPNIDGLVHLALRQLIHDRQKAHDLLGAQVFDVLQSAVRDAIQEGDLHVLRGDSRIRNDTVLGFHAAATPEPRMVDLRPLVARWNDRLLPDLVTLRGRKQADVVRRLRELLPELRHEGAEVLRFKDLIDPLKSDARARWSAVFEQEGGELALEQGGDSDEIRRVHVVPPDLGIEERQFFRRLVACVLESVARLDVNERTRGYLYTFWQFLRVQTGAGDDRSSSARKVAELLRIPRERIPELRQKLGEILSRCYAAHSGKASIGPSRGGTTPADPKGVAS